MSGVYTYAVWGKGSRTVEKGNELLPSAFGAQGEGDSRETSDSIEAENDIVVLRQLSV